MMKLYNDQSERKTFENNSFVYLFITAETQRAIIVNSNLRACIIHPYNLMCDNNVQVNKINREGYETNKTK